MKDQCTDMVRDLISLIWLVNVIDNARGREKSHMYIICLITFFYTCKVFLISFSSEIANTPLLSNYLNAKWFTTFSIRDTKSSYHRFRWYATLENKTPAETFPKFPSVLRVIDRSDRNPPITATSVTFWPSLRHASRLWLVDFDPTCR